MSSLRLDLFRPRFSTARPIFIILAMGYTTASAYPALCGAEGRGAIEPRRTASSRQPAGAKWR
jgi:hypothetical protein